MLGVLINRVLLMLLGYLYPAFECYKTVEKNKVNVEDLRFWCHYWIVVAFLSVFERVGDVFISWLPFYGEAKVAVFVYLWYPSIKGTTHVYGTLLRPHLVKYEPEIDKKLMELRERAWDYVLLHWQSVFAMGQAYFFQAMSMVAGQSNKTSKKPRSPREGSPAPPPSPGKAPSRKGGSTPTKSKLGEETEARLGRAGSADLSDTLQARLKLRRGQSDM